MWTAYEGKTSTGDAAVELRQGRPAGDLLLLLPVGRGLRPGVRQGLRLLPLPGQDLGQRARVGQAAGSQGQDRVHRAADGFASCDDPAALQAICDRFQPGTIEVFAQRWLHRLPLPFTAADHDAGSWRETSMRQAEVSRTVVFDAPRHARGFFEALIAGNPGIGRPHNVEIIVGRKIGRDTKGVFRTAIDRRDNGGVLVNVFCKHSRIKQYLKDGRAMRIETVVNAPATWGATPACPTWASSRPGRAPPPGAYWKLNVSARAPSSRAQPLSGSRTRPPTRTGGGPRLFDSAILGLWPMAGALCQTLLAATGFTNKNLRVLIAGLLGSDYTPGP